MNALATHGPIYTSQNEANYRRHDVNQQGVDGGIFIGCLKLARV